MCERRQAHYGHQVKQAHPRLSCGFLRTGGRNYTGHKTIRTKGPWRVRRRYVDPYACVRGFYTLGLIVRWEPWAAKQGALLLIRSAIGAWCYAPATALAIRFEYIQGYEYSLLFEDSKYVARHWWHYLIDIAPYTLISGVAIAPGLPPRYARAVGSACELLVPLSRKG